MNTHLLTQTAPSHTLADLVKKQIGLRILICLILLLILLAGFTVYDIINQIASIESRTEKECQTLENFIVSEVLVENEHAADVKLNSYNSTHNIHIEWKRNPVISKKEFVRTSFFKWTYYYPLIQLSNNFGYFIVTGSFLGDPFLLSVLIHRIIFFIVFSLLIFILLYPLTRKIPTKLFIEPIDHLLDLIRSGADSTSLEVHNVANTVELRNIEENILKFLREQQENSRKNALYEISTQVAHDIRSPVAAILMISKECHELPENQRDTLRNAATRIQDIANTLLGRYRKDDENISEETTSALASAIIQSVLSEKRMQFKHRNITFTFGAPKHENFTFISIYLVDFTRMISNLINNAAEAIKNDSGLINISLLEHNGLLKITISDNGIGMSQAQIATIMNADLATSNKTDGYGFGLLHAKTTLRKLGATLDITSEVEVGTQVCLAFNIARTPLWITDEICFYPNDTIIVLDDDSSIHGAWDNIFTSFAARYKLNLVHFRSAVECVNYIQSVEDKTNILLLTDYELINQELNGLDVIKASEIRRSILVTSHYDDINIIRSSILLQTKILPKMLAYKASLLPVIATKMNTNKYADLILLDDNLEFASVLRFLYERKNKKLSLYHTPYELLNDISFFPTTTAICLDYNLNCPVTGIDLAKVLWHRGFRKLYLVTGMLKLPCDLPPFIILLKDKMALTKEL